MQLPACGAERVSRSEMIAHGDTPRLSICTASIQRIHHRCGDWVEKIAHRKQQADIFSSFLVEFCFFAVCACSFYPAVAFEAFLFVSSNERRTSPDVDYNTPASKNDGMRGIRSDERLSEPSGFAVVASSSSRARCVVCTPPGPFRLSSEGRRRAREEKCAIVFLSFTFLLLSSKRNLRRQTHTSMNEYAVRSGGCKRHTARTLCVCAMHAAESV